MVYDQKQARTTGIINLQGDWLLSPTQMAEHAYTNLSAIATYSKNKRQYFSADTQVRGNRCFALLDHNGRELTPNRFEQMPYSIDLKESRLINLAECGSGRAGFIDLAAPDRWVFQMPPAYRHLSITDPYPNADGTFRVYASDTNNYGLMNLQGKLVLPVRYYMIKFNDKHRQLATVIQKETSQDKDPADILQGGLVRTDGSWLIPPQTGLPKLMPNSTLIEWRSQYYDDHVPLRYKELDTLRYTDLNGHPIDTPFHAQGIELVGGFDEQGYGLAFALKQSGPDREGFVDPQGRWLIPPQYQFSDEERNKASISQAVLDTTSRAYLTDENGQLAVPPFNRNGHIIARQQGKRGVLDRQGRVIVPFLYDRITLSDERRYIIAANRNGVTSYDFNGNAHPLIVR